MVGIYLECALCTELYSLADTIEELLAVERDTQPWYKAAISEGEFPLG